MGYTYDPGHNLIRALHYKSLTMSENEEISISPKLFNYLRYIRACEPFTCAIDFRPADHLFELNMECICKISILRRIRDIFIPRPIYAEKFLILTRKGIPTLYCYPREKSRLMHILQHYSSYIEQ